MNQCMWGFGIFVYLVVFIPEKVPSKRAFRSLSFSASFQRLLRKRRSTRETTPCNLIRDPDAIRMPGSSTKPTRSSDNKYRVQNTTPRHIPTTSEMDEFFTGPEKQQQRLFIEKYNFDPVNEKPLRGRYEWVKVDGTKKS